MRGFVWIMTAVVAQCASTVASATATAAPSTCVVSAQPVQITGLVFQPPVVAAGQTSQAILSAVNCTDVTQRASAEWLGRFVGSAPIPPGCPVIDPLLQSLNFPPHGQLTSPAGGVTSAPAGRIPPTTTHHRTPTPVSPLRQRDRSRPIGK